MKLHEMTPEYILGIIEERSDKLLEMEMNAGDMEATFKAVEATTTLAFKDSGCSMAEAKERCRTSDAWVSAYGDLQTSQALAAKAKRDYQRAIIAQDLWRSEQATLRKI